MIRNPEDSKVGVLLKFVAELISWKKQLAASYHDNQFLHYKLMTVVDTSSIQVLLSDKISWTAQQLANRVAKRLLNNTESAWSM